MEQVEAWLSRGIARVIIGTAALRDPDFVKAAAKAFPERIAVGIDARDGRVAVEGWAETSDMRDVDLGKRFEDAGVAAIIYTNIARDGMLSGLDFDGTIALGHALTIPVIASGGLASIADIERLAAPECAHLAGAITGRALYDGRLDPAEAISTIRAARALA
jgi:phosphoribosylformimino-5-aminoimidazole carboxamide ribotide isomerase